MAFDLKCEIRDPKSGRIVSTQHYATHLSPDGMVFERDGVYYLEDGSIAPDDVVSRIVPRRAEKKPEAKK